MSDQILEVCVVLMDDGYASTALMPIEVFHSAGALWRELKGEAPEPRFRVSTASIDGKPVRSPYAGLSMAPQYAIADIKKADIVVVPTSGLSLDDKLIENSAILLAALASRTWRVHSRRVHGGCVSGRGAAARWPARDHALGGRR